MHQFRITLEARNELIQPTAPNCQRIQFEVTNHDNLFKIIEAVRSKQLVDHDKSAALALGLKLLSEVVLERRSDPLFRSLSEPLRNFTLQLKAANSSVRHPSLEDVNER